MHNSTQQLVSHLQHINAFQFSQTLKDATSEEDILNKAEIVRRLSVGLLKNKPFDTAVMEAFHGQNTNKDRVQFMRQASADKVDAIMLHAAASCVLTNLKHEKNEP